MKQAKEYTRRVKKLFRDLIRKHGKPATAEPSDPIQQLIEGILAINTTVHKAESAFNKLRQQMVDLNELRVTPAMELAAMIGTSVPMAPQKAYWIVDALNDIRKRQEILDLSFLKERGRREAREYLESLEGVDRSAAARVVLWSLGGHAIPVDDLTLYVLRKNEIVDESADAVTVQHFLERHISAADARAFTELLGKYVATKGARVSAEELPDLLNPPPPPTTEPEPPAKAKVPRGKTAEKAKSAKPRTKSTARTRSTKKTTTAQKVKKAKKKTRTAKKTTKAVRKKASKKAKKKTKK
jgi:endonuclease III